MRTLLLAVSVLLLTFLISARSAPVTEMPVNTEADVLEEAITDGFIAEHSFTPSFPTESSKPNTTTPEPTSEDEGTPKTSDEADSMEGSSDLSMPEQEDGENLYSSPSPSPTQSSSTALPQKDSDLNSNSFSTESPDSHFSPSSTPSADDDIFIEETTESSTTTDYRGAELHPNLQAGNRNLDTTFSPTSTNENYHSDEPTPSVSPGLLPGHSSVSYNTEVPLHSFDSGLTTLSPSSVSHIVPSYSSTSESEDEKILSSTPDTSFSTTSSSSLILSSTPVSGIHSDSETEADAPTEPSTMTPSSTAGVVASTFPGMFVEMEESGSGSEVTPQTSDKSTTASPTSSHTEEMIQVFQPRGIVPETVEQTVSAVKPTPSMSTGHTTPGWMIILAFVVAVAALVLLCVAIATRDRWNGPRHASETKPEDSKANSSNQQRELEMETFLDKEPRENGHSEYTVIPLEELPEKEPLH